MIARPLRFDPVPEGAEELIGYEPLTREFNPQDPEQAQEFLAIYREAQSSGHRILAVRSKRGRLCVWQEALEFWRPPERAEPVRPDESHPTCPAPTPSSH